MPMAENAPFRVREAVWPRDAAAIAQVRRRVFIEEQGVPEAMEWEALDARCDWFLVEGADGAAIGVARLTPDGRIGRMAVVPPWRRQGVGSALLAAALAKARERALGQVSLHAQTHALAFYARAGFHAVGPGFMEAGIPHHQMVLALAT